jgi:hypothetical protein
MRCVAGRVGKCTCHFLVVPNYQRKPTDGTEIAADVAPHCRIPCRCLRSSAISGNMAVGDVSPRRLSRYHRRLKLKSPIQRPSVRLHGTRSYSQSSRTSRCTSLHAVLAQQALSARRADVATLQLHVSGPSHQPSRSRRRGCRRRHDTGRTATSQRDECPATAAEDSNEIATAFASLDAEAADVAEPDRALPPEFRCRYRQGKCSQPRTLKKNGSMHSYCEHHRLLSVRNQKVFDEKRRRQREQAVAKPVKRPRRSRSSSSGSDSDDDDDHDERRSGCEALR